MFDNQLSVNENASLIHTNLSFRKILVVLEQCRVQIESISTEGAKPSKRLE
jgi:hypothetical protein